MHWTTHRKKPVGKPECMCLGKQKGRLKFSDCIGHVAIGVIKHFWSQCTLSCTQNTHSHAASQGRSYQIPLSVTVTGNVSEPSEKLTYALQWCQSEIPGTSSGAKGPIELPGVPDVLHHWLRAALCCSEALLAIFTFVRRLTSSPPKISLKSVLQRDGGRPSTGLSREQCPPQHLPDFPCSLLQTVGNAI